MTTENDKGGNPDVDTEELARQAYLDEQAREKALIEANVQMMREMRSAGSDMFTATASFMKAFLDMRISYLKIARQSIEERSTMTDMMAKMAADLAHAARQEERRTEDDRQADASARRGD